MRETKQGFSFGLLIALAPLLYAVIVQIGKWWAEYKAVKAAFYASQAPAPEPPQAPQAPVVPLVPDPLKSVDDYPYGGH